MIELYYWQYSIPRYPEGEDYFSGFYKSGDRSECPEGSTVEKGYFITEQQLTDRDRENEALKAKLSEAPYNELIQMRQLQADSEREIERLREQLETEKAVCAGIASVSDDRQKDLNEKEAENEALRKEVETLKSTQEETLKWMKVQGELIKNKDAELESARREGFGAARELGEDAIYYAANGTTNIEYKFKTYEDYKLALKSNKEGENEER